jgi:predicted DNA-binding transcriptional regulator AlpA
MSNIPKLLTIADLTKRWDMPRQSIHERIKYRDFPEPIQFVSNGRTAVFLESEIIEFEESNPWITTPERRERRQRFIYSLINK